MLYFKILFRSPGSNPRASVTWKRSTTTKKARRDESSENSSPVCNIAPSLWSRCMIWFIFSSAWWDGKIFIFHRRNSDVDHLSIIYSPFLPSSHNIYFVTSFPLSISTHSLSPVCSLSKYFIMSTPLKVCWCIAHQRGSFRLLQKNILTREDNNDFSHGVAKVIQSRGYIYCHFLIIMV